jgi:hypothetical protein
MVTTHPINPARSAAILRHTSRTSTIRMGKRAKRMDSGFMGWMVLDQVGSSLYDSWSDGKPLTRLVSISALCQFDDQISRKAQK